MTEDHGVVGSNPARPTCSTNMNYAKYRDIILEDISALGSMVFFGIIFFVFMLLKNWSMSYTLLLGMAMIAIIVTILRALYFKERPEKRNFHSWIEKIDASSFPSMHAARGTFLLLILASYMNIFALNILCGILIISICYSRWRLRKHHISDILVGLMIGVFVFYISRNVIETFINI